MDKIKQAPKIQLSVTEPEGVHLTIIKVEMYFWVIKPDFMKQKIISCT